MKDGERRMIVIADDITGAAEIAGIAHRFGLATRMVVASGDTWQLADDNAADIVVIATDTRSMTKSEAVAETVAVARQIRMADDQPVVFKKTDSALRGHVAAELYALMDELHLTQALYMPANPSKGRIIKDGIYYIDGVEIAHTDFSFDPEFPARSSVVEEVITGLGTSKEKKDHRILFADAASADDIRQLVADADNNTILAGAADLFTTMLEQHATTLKQHTTCVPLPLKEGRGGSSSGSSLILCGSTQSKPLDIGIAVYDMPTALYDSRADSDDYHTLVENWTRTISEGYTANGSAILTFGSNTHRTGKASAVYLRNTMAAVAESLIATRRPDKLIIEGGATAFCLLRRLGWTDFQVTGELAPGVVAMRAANGTAVVMKPGSYSWGKKLFC